MSETFEIRRTRAATARVVVNLVCIAGAAGFLIVDAWPKGEAVWIVIGVLFALWAMFIALNLYRRAVLLRVDEKGLWCNNLFSRPFVRWDDMVWAEYGEARRSVMIGYLWGDKERIIGWSKALLGPDDLARLIASLRAQRPDLPGSPYPDWKSKTTKEEQQ